MDNKPQSLRAETRNLAAAIGRFAKSLRLYLTPQDTLDERVTHAVEFGDVARLQKTVAEGGNVNRLSHWREETPLIKAIEMGKVDMVASLLALGANPNAKMRYGTASAMSDAVQKGNVDIMRLLLDAGGNANGRTSQGVNLFVYAVAVKNDAMADLLLSRGANPDAGRDGEWTALAYAARNNDTKRLRQLLDLNVRTYLRNPEGKTAMAVARAGEHVDAANMIQAHIDSKVPVWQNVDENQVAHVGIFRAQGYRLTQIFNFKTEEATMITHNFETGKDSAMVRSFAAVSAKGLIEEARQHLPAAPAEKPAVKQAAAQKPAGK